MTWIKVSEKLPVAEIGENSVYSDECIVYTAGGIIMSGFRHISQSCNNWYSTCGNLDIIVTHWMELPAPPKEEALTMQEIDELISNNLQWVIF